MNVEVGRRVFLGSAAAAGIGTVGGGLLVSSRLSAQTPGERDAIQNELVRQLHESVLGMRGQRRGESARKLASTLRLTAAHYETEGVDTALRSYLQAAIRRDGRDALLQREVDPQMLAAEARGFGLATLPALSPVDYAVRERVLDSLLVRGITPVLTNVAKALDEISDALDAQPLPSLINARQYESCADIANMLRILEITLAISCLWNAAMCVVITGMWVGLQLSLWAYGC